MTTPANLTLTQIETRVANALRIPTTNTGEMAKIDALINEVYRDIYVLQDWWWLQKRTIINTVAKVGLTSATVTLDSTTVSGMVADASSTLANSMVGYVMVVPGQAHDTGAVYRVDTHTAAATSLTLDAAYTDTTSTTAAPTFYKDAYALPADTGKVLNVKRFGETAPLRRSGVEEMSALKLNDQTEGKPEAFAVFDFATTGDPTTQRLIQVYPFPDRAYRLEILYKQQLNTELSSTTQPFMPDEYRHLLIYGALARGYAIYHKDAQQSAVFQGLFEKGLVLMAQGGKEYNNDHTGIAPDDTYRRGRRPRRSGRLTLGRYFDVLPNEP